MMQAMRRTLAALALALAALGVAATAASQPGKSRRVLHEPLPSPITDTEPSPLLGKPAGSGNPAAIAAGDKVLPVPPLNDRPDGEPVLGTDQFGADRNTESAPDRATDRDGTLHYASVFNPDVLPFKRMSALDAVRDDYTLVIARDDRVDLQIVGTNAADRNRDRFWGSMPIRLQRGVAIPLPSVAPDMRILSYDTQPKVALTFSKDGADNFYVRSDARDAGGDYRLVFLADADAGYFAPRLPDDRRYTPADVAELTPRALVPQVPAKVRRAAARVHEMLGIDERTKLDVAFNRLVGFFRGFEAKTLPPASDDIYLDLCNSKAGVCRHRSFAFMVTANALGLPTRYVTNEAHAFVEVWFPKRGWQRVDLGGAALNLEVSGGDGKTLHRPRAEDPFDKPREYRENYTQLQGNISGLSQNQIDDRRRPTDQAPASGDFDATAPGSGSGSGSGAGNGTPGSLDLTPEPGRITPNTTLPIAKADPTKPTPELIITRADTVAYRGGRLHIEGKASVKGKPMAGRPIDVFLSRLGSRGTDSMLLRRVLTGADGTFSADFDVPAEAKLAPHEVRISSPEDASYNGALSQ